MLSLSPTANLETFTESANQQAQTDVYLATKDRILAAISIADVVRPERKHAVQSLQETGDSRTVANAVADQLGIRRVFAEVLPEHKDQKIIELQQQGKRVTMVGDGVNDAPALTRANVGIAIGGGTDVAIESAGIVLVNSNPLDVVKIFKLSRASYSKMIQNLWWRRDITSLPFPWLLECWQAQAFCFRLQSALCSCH